MMTGLYRFFRRIAHLVLLAFVLCKSAAPIKEIFSATPGDAFYDDTFFVNSQAMSASVNKHRVNLVLQFTFDELPAAPSSVQDGCTDRAGTVGQDAGGRRFVCSDLKMACSEKENVREACPWTCGLCNATSRVWSEDMLEEVHWTPLNFKNLPGDPSRWPSFHSPYHYRLDWETWVQSGASAEHWMEQWLAQAGRQSGKRKPRAEQRLPLLDMPLPGHVSVLITKILAGDTDAIGLMGTSASQLLRQTPPERKGAPARGPFFAPTAIRADYFAYQFSTWRELSMRGEWWSRARISNAYVFERAPNVKASWGPSARRTPWQRHWLLALSVLGMYMTISSTLTNSLASDRRATLALALGRGVVAFAYYLICFGSALSADYTKDDLAPSIVRQLMSYKNSLRWPLDEVFRALSTQFEPGYVGVTQMSSCALAVALLHVVVLSDNGSDRWSLARIHKWGVWDAGRSVAVPALLCWLGRQAAESQKELLVK